MSSGTGVLKHIYVAVSTLMKIAIIIFSGVKELASFVWSDIK
jgi:hypothetical protein